MPAGSRLATHVVALLTLFVAICSFTATAPALTYDANGNELTNGSWSYAYDAENRLASADDGAQETAYAYDGAGKLLTTDTGSTLASKLWDASFSLPQLALERNFAGNQLRRYVSGLDTIGFSDPNGDDFYYHQDAFGSIANVTDEAGDPQWTYAYEPFGAVRSVAQEDPQAPQNPLGFSGEYGEPESGLLYLRARRYESGSGRFLTLDPLAPGIGQARVSPYAYVDGRPTLFSDPSGMSFGCFFDVCNVAKDVGSGVQGVGEAVFTINTAPYRLTAQALLHPLQTRDSIYSGLMAAEDLYHQKGLLGALGAAGDYFLVQPIKACLAGATSTDVERSARSCTKALATLLPLGRAAQIPKLTALLETTRGLGAATRRTLPRVDWADQRGSVGGAAKVGASALEDASAAAFKAADNIDAFTLSAKHLPGAGGTWTKFGSGVDPRAAIEEALRSKGAMFRPNAGTSDRFRVVTDLGRVVGSRGETAVRVVVSNDGRVITAFPVRG